MTNTHTVSILGCGWLGLALGKRLYDAGYRVKGSTTQPEKISKLADNGIEPFVLQGNKAGWQKGIAHFLKCDTLVLTIPPGRRDPARIDHYSQVVDSLLDRVLVQANIPKVIYTSSTGVYGAQTGWVNESNPIQPVTNSAQAVAKAETIIMSRLKDYIILRLAGLYGPDRHPGRWLAGKQDLPGGAQPVNLVHRDDVVAALMLLIGTETTKELFNICSDAHPRKSVYYTEMARRLGVDPPKFATDTALQGKKIDNKKLKQATGFEYGCFDPSMI